LKFGAESPTLTAKALLVFNASIKLPAMAKGFRTFFNTVLIILTLSLRED